MIDEMFRPLRDHIMKRIDLTADEFTRCTPFFSSKKIRRNQFLLQEGEVCRNVSFVVHGCLRSYSVDEKGEEHIVQFAVEDWWVSDLRSYLSGEPSLTSIDAIEDSDLLLLEKASREKLFLAVPKMERFFRILLERQFVASNKRIVDSLSASARERYLSFLDSFPSMAQRVPQGQIASYLGITPQSLSRIRREISKKKPS
jgi:CRP-like cAMP-binding protein